MRRISDIVVVGGGHAGIEAASIAARMGLHVELITMDSSAIGRLSCNPAIGGMAKGQLVCEIDALGGEMGRIADAAGLQFKMLGRSKGPAMWSPRAQMDKDLYPVIAQQRLNAIPNLTIVADAVEDIVVENGRIVGLSLRSAGLVRCRAVVICSGTFLQGRMHVGLCSTNGGRFGEDAAEGLSASLRSAGFVTGRLKTGTPPRIHRDSIDIRRCHVDAGDTHPKPFSRSTESVTNRIDCYATVTTPETHSLLREGFKESPMFTGRITGTGPRYCPSIEDKIDRFADRDSHHIILEPEGLKTDSVYVNGFSTSLPEAVQLAALRSVPALESCDILRYGYAVEYDYLPSYQLQPTLETKQIRGLYFAGQVNGTSGYEEAAAQGLIAGINSALAIRGEEPFVMDRSTSYIGVLIDDLVNLTIEEPYRMFTSRAEYRLLLRQDNADLRLTQLAARLGVIPTDELDRVSIKQRGVDRACDLLAEITLYPHTADEHLSMPVKAWQLLKRPDVALSLVIDHLGQHAELLALLSDKQVAEQVEIAVKYDGYIKRQLEEVDRFAKIESKIIPDSFDYHRLRTLSSEGREKLSRIRPRSLGQASRIAGVSRSDIAVLTMFVR